MRIDFLLAALLIAFPIAHASAQDNGENADGESEVVTDVVPAPAPDVGVDAAVPEPAVQPFVQPSGSAPMQFIGDGAVFLPRRSGVSWDFQIEGGWAASLKNELPHHWFGRARAGMLILYEPLLAAFGPTFELGGLIGSGVGGQLDLVNISAGYSIEAGGAFAFDGAFVSHLSIGFALFGVEWQQRFGDGAAAAILFKLRIPVGAFVYLATHR